MIFALAFSTQAYASTEEVAGSSEGYLISDTGETVFVKGIRVETPFRYSLDEEITTYEFTLYGNPEYVLSGNQTDGSESIKVYLNINHKVIFDYLFKSSYMPV